MSPKTPAGRRWLAGIVVANTSVSHGMRVIELELPEPVAFGPGQFAMLNLGGLEALTFGRPFSILAAQTVPSTLCSALTSWKNSGTLGWPTVVGQPSLS